MATATWPRCPNLDGLPFDTALLLSRDHVAQVRKLMSQSEKFQLVTTPEILSLLHNVLAFHDILCQRGPAQQAAIDALANVHVSVPLLVQTSQSTNTFIRRAEDRNYANVKDEATAVDRSLALSDANDETFVDAISPLDSPSAGNDEEAPLMVPPENDERKKIKVTIRILDDDIRQNMKQNFFSVAKKNQLQRLIERDIRPHRFRIRSPKVMTRSGDVRFEVLATEAKVLRDASKYQPKSFGGGAFVSTKPPKCW